MLPLALDLASWPVIVCGRGPAMRKRIALLDGAAATDVTIFAPEPDDRAALAGRRLLPRLPADHEIPPARLLLAAGLTAAEETRIGTIASNHRVLLNIEDRLPWCDLHVPAIVRRGDLLIAISTGGRSPAVAVALREHLARRFGPEWADHLAEAATLRDHLRTTGVPPAEISQTLRALPFLRALEPPPPLPPSPSS